MRFTADFPVVFRLYFCYTNLYEVWLSRDCLYDWSGKAFGKNIGDR